MRVPWVLDGTDDGWVKSDVGSLQVAGWLTGGSPQQDSLGGYCGFRSAPCEKPECLSRHSGFPVHMKVKFPLYSVKSFILFYLVL